MTTETPGSSVQPNIDELADRAKAGIRASALPAGPVASPRPNILRRVFRRGQQPQPALRTVDMSAPPPDAEAVSSGAPEKKIELSGTAKTIYDKLRPIAAMGGYVINPLHWPSLAYRGVRGYVANAVHPLVSIANVALNKGRIDRQEFRRETSYYTGVLWGMTEAALVYNVVTPALTPAGSRLVRAGLSAAIGYGPQAYLYLHRTMEKRQLQKGGMSAAEAEATIKNREKNHPKAFEFTRRFSQGRGAAYTWMGLFTPGGLITTATEMAAEKILHGAGIDFDNVREGLLTKFTGKTTIDRMIESDLIQNPIKNVLNDPKTKDLVDRLTSEQVTKAYADNGLTEDQIPQEARDAFVSQIRDKTVSVFHGSLETIARDSLTQNPKNIAGAIQAGQDQLAQAQGLAFPTPEEEQKWLDENKDLLKNIIDQEQAKQAATAAPPTQVPPAQPSGTDQSSGQQPDDEAAVQTAKEEAGNKQVFTTLTEYQKNPATINELAQTTDKFIGDHPEIGIAKAAAVGAKLEAITDQEYDAIFKQNGIDPSRMSPETVAKIKERFHSSFQPILEVASRQAFDDRTQAAIAAGVKPSAIDVNQLITDTRAQFFGDLDKTDSPLRSAIHKQATDKLLKIVYTEGRAAMVGEHMAQIDRATNEALDKLGIKVTDQIRQNAHYYIQREAEKLAERSMDQAWKDLSNSTQSKDLLSTTRAHFEADLQAVLDKEKVQSALRAYVVAEATAAVEGHQADFEKAAKEGVAEALKNHADTQTIISPFIYDRAVEEAKEGKHYRYYYIAAYDYVTNYVTKVDVADPDPAHLQQAVHTAAAEGRKQFEAQLASPDSLKTTHDRIANVINYHLEQDQFIRGQINKVLVENYTSVTIKPRQTVSHIFLEANQPLHFNPTDARPLAAFIATNYDQLADMHYAFEQAGNLEADNFYPVNLDNLYNIMIAAESGNIDARRKLMQAVWMIQAGKNVKLVSLENQAKIIDILKKYNWRSQR